MPDKYIMPELKEAKRLVAELGRGFEEMKNKIARDKKVRGIEKNAG